MAQAAGGADVCGFARAYVSSDDSLGALTRIGMMDSQRSDRNETFVHSGLATVLDARRTADALGAALGAGLPKYLQTDTLSRRVVFQSTPPYWKPCARGHHVKRASFRVGALVLANRVGR